MTRPAIYLFWAALLVAQCNLALFLKVEIEQLRTQQLRTQVEQVRLLHEINRDAAALLRKTAVPETKPGMGL